GLRKRADSGTSHRMSRLVLSATSDTAAEYTSRRATNLGLLGYLTWSVLPFQVGLRSNGWTPPPARRPSARAVRAGGGLLGGKDPTGPFPDHHLLLPWPR